MILGAAKIVLGYIMAVLFMFLTRDVAYYRD